MSETLDETVAGIMTGVSTTIADGDSMFAGNNIEHYMSVSRDALRAVLAALQVTGRPEPKRLLDFGCGYGRVLRSLRAAFPAAELIACDMDPAALAGCAQAFGARAVIGAPDVDHIEQVTEVDLLWCGSVLTHLDASNWGPLLRYFARALAPGGVAVVTTHGRRMAMRAEAGKDYGLDARATDRMLAAYKACGFGYNNYEGNDGYGISLSSPGWAVQRALETPDLRLAGYDEAAWDRHQDVMVLVKDANATLKADL
ncbi:class I SAM-dependent methyltransferase [Amycolatopsis sp. NPDC051071]|uniref:class I SAM-dependent methyltransferase n=1 Tax=Amycolatopsis sp. NPDC051071 TaxID=3154637 RepID=UPI003412D7BB